MKLYEVLSNLHFNIYPDCEGDNNRGWQIDRIDAYDEDGTKVGYIKISYMPSSRFKKWFPTLEAFAKVFGSSVGIYGIPTKETHPYDWERLLKECQQLYKDYKNFYIDKPVVDFIRVIDDKDKRQGVGTALYREAVKYLANKGMKLYASGVQSEQAKAAWAKFEQAGKVGTEPAKFNGKPITRRYLISL